MQISCFINKNELSPNKIMHMQNASVNYTNETSKIKYDCSK